MGEKLFLKKIQEGTISRIMNTRLVKDIFLKKFKRVLNRKYS